jgi:hypothetical protein
VQRIVRQRDEEDRAPADLLKDLGPPRVTATKLFVQPDLDPSTLKIAHHGSDRACIMARVTDEHLHRTDNSLNRPGVSGHFAAELPTAQWGWVSG